MLLDDGAPACMPGEECATDNSDGTLDALPALRTVDLRAVAK